MANRYPVGIQDFSELRSNGYLYVDKTPFIEKLFEHGKYYFLSRPRRFGKSLFVSALHYLFQGREDLFTGLHIAKRWEWSKTNPVIKISFSNIGHKDKGLALAINDELDVNAKNYGIALSADYNSGKFKELIETLFQQQGQVVVLIDEYDKPIIDFLGVDTEMAVANRNTLKAFYSVLKDADPYLKLVFITGVSKFSRVSIFSDLNNITDLTMDRGFGGICGITQEEMEVYFEEELTVFEPEKIKSWYNGYSWDLRSKVYNPFSLLHFFRSKEFKNYWFETGTPTFLINLSKDQDLYDFERLTIDSSRLSAYDIERLQLIPLMFQTGYLTLVEGDSEADLYTLDYPNREVRLSYLNLLADSYMQDPLSTGRAWANNFLRALEKGELDKLQSLFNSLFKSIPYEIWQKENEHFYHALIHLTFSILGVFVQSQVQSADGRLDALVQTKNHIYAFEFKLDGSAEVALQQIKDKAYLQPYVHQGKTCIGIGLNFSKANKKVESLLWETFQA
jgi:hypothetical protein